MESALGFDTPYQNIFEACNASLYFIIIQGIPALTKTTKTTSFFADIISLLYSPRRSRIRWPYKVSGDPIHAS